MNASLPETDCLHGATKQKYHSFFAHVHNMKVRQKRQVFSVLRNTQELSSDTFLPAYGLFCGEFAAFQILAEYSRKEASRRDPSTPSSGSYSRSTTSSS